MKRPRVLLASVEPPSAGGSGTAAVELFNRMLGGGWDVHHTLLMDAAETARYEALFGGTLGDAGGQSNAVTTFDADLRVGCGFIAAQRLISAAPEKRTILLTGTCRQAQDHVTSGRVADAISLQRSLEQGTLVPRILNTVERFAVERCDLVVTHSGLTLTMFEKFFPGSIGKVYPSPISFAEWIADGALAWRHLARPFEERDIDVLFIASDWKRREKNYPMVDAIARQLGTHRVHVVGKVPHRLPAVTHHGFVQSREALFTLMGRARTIACPSMMDAAPGVLFEGAVMGCNVVASKNCGNWEICHPELLATPFCAVTFATRINTAAKRKFGDHLELLRERGGYRELMAIFEAFCEPLATERAR